MYDQRQFHLIYSGSVQGVGFRYTAEQLASSFGIKGWVRNISGARVEMAASGKARNIDLFLQAIKKEFPSAAVSGSEEPLEDFTGFEIRF